MKNRRINRNRCRLGLRPRPHCGSLQRSPRPHSWFQGGRFAAGGEWRGGRTRGGEKGEVGWMAPWLSGDRCPWRHILLIEFCSGSLGQGWMASHVVPESCRPWRLLTVSSHRGLPHSNDTNQSSVISLSYPAMRFLLIGLGWCAPELSGRWPWTNKCLGLRVHVSRRLVYSALWL